MLRPKAAVAWLEQERRGVYLARGGEECVIWLEERGVCNLAS